VVRGDTPGAEWRFPVYRFGPTSGEPTGPSVYLQGGLHADELPGVSVLHVLADHLRRAEAAGEVCGTITLVPYANPIGLNQQLFSASLGRFDFGTRTNFNRGFPLLDRPDQPLRAAGDDPAVPAQDRLKARLLGLTLHADIVLDLHCDDESLQYVYLHQALWPAAQDLAVAIGARAALLWGGGSDAAFEEAAIAPHLAEIASDRAGTRRVVSTVEFRGQADVNEALARQDAEGLVRFLAGRGVLANATAAPKPGDWRGVAAPLQVIEMVRAPVGGALWYHVAPGDQVEAGDRLVTILHDPGAGPEGETHVHAPQAGLVLTRRHHRATRSGEDLLKLVGTAPSAAYKPGALES
jgi:predicted deacylase